MQRFRVQDTVLKHLANGAAKEQKHDKILSDQALSFEGVWPKSDNPRL
jgi:hypothetical protein